MICKAPVLAAALLGIFQAFPALGQQAIPSGLACISDIPVPAYKGVFWIARVTGEAQATFTIADGGTVASLNVASAQPALVAWLKSALAGSRFHDRCAGGTLDIKFVYRLVGDPAEIPQSEVRFKGPNTFEIIARPPASRVIPD